MVIKAVISDITLTYPTTNWIAIWYYIRRKLKGELEPPKAGI